MDSALLLTFPPDDVFVKPSAKRAARGSGLLACCDFSHCCSRSATAFSVATFFWAKEHVVVAKKTRPSTHPGINRLISPPLAFSNFRGNGPNFAPFDTEPTTLSSIWPVGRSLHLEYLARPAQFADTGAIASTYLQGSDIG